MTDYLIPRAPKAWAPHRLPPPYQPEHQLIEGDTWPEILGCGSKVLWRWNRKIWDYLTDNVPTHERNEPADAVFLEK